MKIVADENIPFVREAFGTLGALSILTGRAMDRSAVADADVLLVRSVTKVNADLLEGASVRFVGAATIGTEHIDQDYLSHEGVTFTSAAGSNANSVAEYVTAALLVMSRRLAMPLVGQSLGVIGVGNVGSKVVRNARALGMTVLPNDPPLDDVCARNDLVSLEDALTADFVTLHVPLERAGRHPTYHMADVDFLARMSTWAVLINSSRGAVVDTPALKDALESGHLAAAVMDVWEDEPAIDAQMLRRTAIGTPHIAGYSTDGKVAGTVILYRALCGFLGVEPKWSPDVLMPPSQTTHLTLDATGRSDEDVIREAVLGVYDILSDDARLRTSLDLDPVQRPAHFDHLRKTYPVRREFPYTELKVKSASPALLERLQALGFDIR